MIIYQCHMFLVSPQFSSLLNQFVSEALWNLIAHPQWVTLPVPSMMKRYKCSLRILCESEQLECDTRQSWYIKTTLKQHKSVALQRLNAKANYPNRPIIANACGRCCGRCHYDVINPKHSLRRQEYPTATSFLKDIYLSLQATASVA